MKKLIPVLVLSLFASVAIAKHVHAAGSKTVTINCGKGQTSSLGGVYGNVSISVGCSNGHTSTQTIMPTGTVWSMRVGVETRHGASDCAFNGDSETVAVNCSGTEITIQ